MGIQFFYFKNIIIFVLPERLGILFSAEGLEKMQYQQHNHNTLWDNCYVYLLFL